MSLIGRQENLEASLLTPEVAPKSDLVGCVSVEVIADYRSEPTPGTNVIKLFAVVIYKDLK